jgi:hypothetical protein
MRQTVALAAASLVWLAGGCSSSTTSSSAHDAILSAEPPLLLVHTDHGREPASAWTYCWRTPGQQQCADGVWTVPTAGPVGTWLVDVRGRGPEGDVASTFRWRTTRAGYHVAPSAACAGR